MDCKPAVPFAGARLVDFTMANAARSGLRQMLVALQYRPQLLARHLRAVWGRNSRRAGAVRRDVGAAGGYRGTADAVRAHLPDLTASGADEVLVLSADHVYQMDYRAMLHRHRESGAKLTVAVDEIPLAQAGRFGVLTADAAGRVTAFDEKPRHPQPIADRPTHALVSMGIYVIDRLWLSDLLRRTDMDDFGQDVLPEAVAQGVVQVHRTGADFYWRDVGTLDSYRLAQLDFLATGTPPLLVPASAHLPGREVRRAAGQGMSFCPGRIWGGGHGCVRPFWRPAR
ncbi:sugar phosphate nucleotidyltransferase [Gemmobacter lanyuensis]